MRIKSLKISDHKPIKSLEIEGLGDIVIIAGANGSGKTRLKQAIISTLQGAAAMSITIESTRPEEEDPKYFNGTSIEVVQGQKNPILANYISSRKYGSGRFVGSLVQIDSDRSIKSLNYNTQVNWLGGDPDDSDSPSNFYCTAFTNRWRDFISYIYQKHASRDKRLAEAVKANPSLTGEEVIRKNPDPFEKYQRIFSEVLPGKKLLDIDPKSPREFHYEDQSGLQLPFNSLSSGEQEVVKILFDVARKQIKHSVILVDEPELHLHPTLTFKLIEALKEIGDHTNQFIFLTHSADLISTYYSTGNVYFIDSEQSGENQCHRLSDLDETHHEVVELIGQNLGLFAVGKKLVFVEGESSSIDRLSYHAIAQKINPEIRVIPVGSVLNLMTLSAVEKQIRNSVFGIDISMVRDRDGLSESQIQKIEENGKIKCLKRRHIENYFLDSEVLFKVAEQLYLTTSLSNLTREYIEEKIKEIATNSINFNLFKNAKEFISINNSFGTPKIRNIEELEIDDLKSRFSGEVATNLQKLNDDFGDGKIIELLNSEEVRLREMLNSEEWIKCFQGKYIFSKVCSDILKTNEIRIRSAYIDIALKEKPEAIQDIMDIFSGF